jgi:hypothetical protein
VILFASVTLVVAGATLVVARATLVVAGVAEVLAGVNGIEGASGNSRPSRNSTIRPSAFSRKRCMPIPPPGMIGDRR